MPQPTEFPANDWPAFLAARVDALLDQGRALVEQLKDGAPRTTDEVLALWNDADIAIGTASARAHLFAEVHPDAAIREAAEASAEAAENLVTERGLDHELWQVVAATSPDGLGPDALRAREHVLRDFRRAGVDRSAADRERLRSLGQRCTELGLEFSRNIREGVRTLRVPPEQLAGLPDDFVAEHQPGDDGLVALTTEYPDMVPVRTYATDPELRLALTREYLLLAYPANEPVLAELLRLRAERAALLGYPDWPTYETETRMIGSGAAVAEFIDRLDALTAQPATADVATMLARYRRDVPGATGVTSADNLYYDQVIRREDYDVDAQEVRRYFRYPAVRDGVLATVSRLFDLTFTPVEAVTWHDDVRVYDVEDGGEHIGRIYLDMHPRDGKYNHAAQFTLTPGITGRQLPEGVLVCNFPTGLMEHDDVVTFFHEFGHLVHEILGGAQSWEMFTGVATEWDFVEAPGQLLEEWAWDPGVLATFATDDAGRPIPADLVERMRRADTFARGAWTRRQVNFTALSYGLHAQAPADLAAFSAQVDEHFGPYSPLDGTHQYAGFGHLDGYGSAYYTYLWSLVIARDLLSAFDADLMDPAVGRRYRDAILAPGGSADAATLVERFLGRPTSFAPFEAWLTQG